MVMVKLLLSLWLEATHSRSLEPARRAGGCRSCSDSDREKASREWGYSSHTCSTASGGGGGGGRGAHTHTQ